MSKDYICPKCACSAGQVHNDYYDMDKKYKCYSCNYESENESEFLKENNNVLYVASKLKHAKIDIDLEDIKNKKCYEHYCTVGRLREFLEEHNLPDDAKVFIQRVEDVYFEENGWGTIKKEGWFYHSDLELIKKAKSGGEFHDKEQYPRMTDEHIKSILDIENHLDEDKEEYMPAWCPVKYKDDDNLYLDAHY